MRRALLFLPIVMIAAVAGLGARQEEKRPVLKNGDPIIAKGCLHGRTLEAADAGPADGDSLLPTGLTFQLKGKKDFLKDLIAKHDGQLVEITGVLKSKIDSGATLGRKIGNARIVVGAGSSIRDRTMMPNEQELLPVLEVKSFEGAGLNCRR